jgi:hypothetical protein
VSTSYRTRRIRGRERRVAGWGELLVDLQRKKERRGKKKRRRNGKLGQNSFEF